MSTKVKRMRALAFLFVASLGLVPAGAQDILDPTIVTTAAKNYIGEHATVCGRVDGGRTVTDKRGTPTFIDLDGAYPNQKFTIVIWGDDRPNVGKIPTVGAHVCVWGMVEGYHGMPQIVVKNQDQLKTQP